MRSQENQPSSGCPMASAAFDAQRAQIRSAFRLSLPGVCFLWVKNRSTSPFILLDAGIDKDMTMNLGDYLSGEAL
jgi:hypothetical protein